MSEASLGFGAAQWFEFFLHYLSLSLLAVGGAVATAPEMHRFLVEKNHWLTDIQFNTSIAIAQAAPGPNVLFIALIGWNVGMNAGGHLSGLLGVFLALAGILLPSTLLTYNAAQWGQRNSELRGVRAFKQGMGPVVVALILSTSWILGTSSGISLEHWPQWLVTVVTALICWQTRLHLLWLLGAGALLGWFGWI